MHTPEDRAVYCAWDEYYVQMAQLLPGVTMRGQGVMPQGCRYYKQFKQLAEYCVKMNYDIRDFIRTVLPRIVKATTYVTVTDLLKADAFQIYEKVMTQRQGRSDIVMEWDVFRKRVLQMCADRPDIFVKPEYTLMAAVSPFPAWFSMCYCEVFNDTLFGLYGARAWEELRLDPAVRGLMRKHRPQIVEELERRLGLLGDVIPTGASPYE